jgi:hypothetical protein
MDASGVSARQVRRVLLRLADVGMAVQDGSGGWVAIPRDLDEVAADLRVLGRGEARKTRHARDRLGRLLALERWVAEGKNDHRRRWKERREAQERERWRARAAKAAGADLRTGEIMRA